MMSFEASAAHRRLSDTLTTATALCGRSVHALADDALRAYAAALDDRETSEARWRAFFVAIALLADALAREPRPPHAALAELHALLRENEDLLALDRAAR
jgi:hypothetical protein